MRRAWKSEMRVSRQERWVELDMVRNGFDGVQAGNDSRIKVGGTVEVHLAHIPTVLALLQLPTGTGLQVTSCMWTAYKHNAWCLAVLFFHKISSATV